MHPAPHHAELTLQASLAQIGVAQEWLHDQTEHCAVPPEQVMKLDICLDEVLANVVMHAGESAEPIVLTLECTPLTANTQATLTVSDAGAPFNPLAHTPKDLPTSLEDATVGGLGIRMVRSYAQELCYRYADGRNHFSFGLSWPTPVAASAAPAASAH
jgi:anti-sigma regulatory factor (Ser/Thr protein kinase)